MPPRGPLPASCTPADPGPVQAQATGRSDAGSWQPQDGCASRSRKWADLPSARVQQPKSFPKSQVLVFPSQSQHQCWTGMMGCSSSQPSELKIPHSLCLSVCSSLPAGDKCHLQQAWPWGRPRWLGRDVGRGSRVVVFVG